MSTAMRRRRRYCFVTWLPVLLLAVTAQAQPVEPGFDAEGSRSFFHWDMNASGFYSARGVSLSSTGSSHWQPTDRIPRNYVGGEYIYTVGETSPLRDLLGPLEFTTVDLNPHVEVDLNAPRQKADATSVDINSDDGQRRVRLKLVLHDFWLRFAPEGMERTTIRVGHFDIPYGINPIMAPRGGVFVMPPEIDDIGFKKDWGVGWKAPLGQYDYELAATTGTGLGLHSPRWFEDASRRSFALSARLGAPTYWHFQYGLSGLYGKVPTIMADERLSSRAFERWRVGADVFYKWQEHTMFMSQVGFGENGDQLFDTGTPRSKVLAAHVLVDHVPPWFQLLNFKVQAKTVFYDLDQSHSDRSNILFEVAYSLSNPVMLRLDYVHDFRAPASMAAMGMGTDDRIYLTINFYS